MDKEAFFPAIRTFMSAPPEEFIQGLNKLFVKIGGLSFEEAIAAYQTIDLIMELRSEELKPEELKVLLAIRDRAILGRLSSFIYDRPLLLSLNGGDSNGMVKIINKAIGKKVFEGALF